MSVKNHKSSQLGMAYNNGNHHPIGNTITCRRGRRHAARQQAKLLKKQRGRNAQKT